MRLRLFGFCFFILILLIAGSGISTSQQAAQVSLNIYTDASGSMRGYVAHNSEYSLFIRSLRGFLNNYTNIRFYQGGGTIPLPSITSQNFENMASNVNLFTSGETNLVNLFNQAPLTNNEVNILITDGILSCKGDANINVGFDLFALTKCLQPIIAKQTAFFVMGIKSSFNGRIYSEFSQGINFQWTGRRPFFIFFWGRNETNVRNCINRIDKEFRAFMQDSGLNNSLSNNEYRILQLSPFRTTQVKVDLNTIPNIIRDTPEKCRDNHQQPQIIFTKRFNIHQSDRVILSNDGPVEDVECPFNLKIKYSVEEQEHYPSIYTPVVSSEHSNYFDFTNNNGQIILKFNHNFVNFFKFGDFNRYDHNHFHGLTDDQWPLEIKFNLQKVTDINIWDDWSTFNDSLPQNALKIYNLSKVLNAILETAVANSPAIINIGIYTIIFER